MNQTEREQREAMALELFGGDASLPISLDGIAGLDEMGVTMESSSEVLTEQSLLDNATSLFRLLDGKPWHEALPAVARWMSEPGNTEALIECLRWDLEESLPRVDVEQRMRALLAALGGEGER